MYLLFNIMLTIAINTFLIFVSVKQQNERIELLITSGAAKWTISEEGERLLIISGIYFDENISRVIEK